MALRTVVLSCPFHKTYSNINLHEKTHMLQFRCTWSRAALLNSYMSFKRTFGRRPRSLITTCSASFIAIGSLATRYLQTHSSCIYNYCIMLSTVTGVEFEVYACNRMPIFPETPRLALSLWTLQTGRQLAARGAQLLRKSNPWQVESATVMGGTLTLEPASQSSAQIRR